LAPMEDVTDAVFRKICKDCGADVVFSEFASADALIRNVKPTLEKLQFDETERPFGIQIFGNEINTMCEAAIIAQSLHPDFIDINWGCPVKKVAAKSAGSGMLQNIPLLLSITKAVVKSVQIPVTVKTRLGYDLQSEMITDFAEKLQDVGIQMITVHGRTKTQMYKGVADWTLIGKLKQNPRIHIPIIGNGDIVSAQQAADYQQLYAVDGIMIGRSAIGNPWIFKQCKDLIINNIQPSYPSNKDRLNICKQHFQLSIATKGDFYGILNMRKHYKHYFSGFENFKDLKIRLLTSNNISQIEDIFQQIEDKYC